MSGGSPVDSHRPSSVSRDGTPASSVRLLSDLRVGERGRVTRVGGGDATVQRMGEMGLIAGTEVVVLRFAPLGDPIEIRVRGYSLSLRKEQAREIEVVPVAGTAR